MDQSYIYGEDLCYHARLASYINDSKESTSTMDSSVWTEAHVQADEATPRKADFFLRSSHTCIQNETCTPGHSYCTLCCKRLTHHMLKNCWSMTLEIRVSALVSVRSLSEWDFHLYIQALQKISPFFGVST